MRGWTRTLLWTGLWIAAGVAHAQIYVCRDAAGRTITGDRVMPECADRAVRELNRSGLVRREIPPPLTVDQKRQKLADDERRRSELAAQEDQRRQDRALLLRFSNEDDIEAARSRAIVQVRERIALEWEQQKNREKQLVAMRAEGGGKQPEDWPTSLRDRIRAGQQSLIDGQTTIKNYRADIARINLRFDAERKRYRELTAPPPEDMIDAPATSIARH